MYKEAFPSSLIVKGRSPSFPRRREFRCSAVVSYTCASVRLNPLSDGVAAETPAESGRAEDTRDSPTARGRGCIRKRVSH